MFDPQTPEPKSVELSEDETTARFPDASIDAPSAASAGEPEDDADPETAPVPITAWSDPAEMEAMSRGLKPKANPAEWMFDRIVRLIEDFEKHLNGAEEVGAHLVQAPGVGAFHVLDVGFWGPDLILFYGKNEFGRPVRLIQHYESVSILLTAMPKQTEQPRRIGFQLREKLEKAAAEGAAAPAQPSTAPAASADEPPRFA